MRNTLLMDFSVDKEKKTITVKKEFAAPLPMVWDAYTKKEILDRWWAPKPWKAKTKSMDFKAGGSWLYAMVGPNGDEHWAVANYINIEPGKSFTVKDAFADSNGSIKEDMPQSTWHVTFREKEGVTLVEHQITYEDLSDLEATIQMGFKEGFAAGLGNLDEIFEQKS